MKISRHQDKFRVDHGHINYTANTLAEAVIYARGLRAGIKYAKSILEGNDYNMEFSSDISTDDVDKAVIDGLGAA